MLLIGGLSLFSFSTFPPLPLAPFPYSPLTLFALPCKSLKGQGSKSFSVPDNTPPDFFWPTDYGTSCRLSVVYL